MARDEQASLRRKTSNASNEPEEPLTGIVKRVYVTPEGCTKHIFLSTDSFEVGLDTRSLPEILKIDQGDRVIFIPSNISRPVGDIIRKQSVTAIEFLPKTGDERLDKRFIATVLSSSINQTILTCAEFPTKQIYLHESNVINPAPLVSGDTLQVCLRYRTFAINNKEHEKIYVAIKAIILTSQGQPVPVVQLPSEPQRITVKYEPRKQNGENKKKAAADAINNTPATKEKLGEAPSQQRSKEEEEEELKQIYRERDVQIVFKIEEFLSDAHLAKSKGWRQLTQQTSDGDISIAEHFATLPSLYELIEESEEDETSLTHLVSTIASAVRQYSQKLIVSSNNEFIRRREPYKPTETSPKDDAPQTPIHGDNVNTTADTIVEPATRSAPAVAETPKVQTKADPTTSNNNLSKLRAEMEEFLTRETKNPKFVPDSVVYEGVIIDANIQVISFLQSDAFVTTEIDENYRDAHKGIIAFRNRDVHPVSAHFRKGDRVAFNLAKPIHPVAPSKMRTDKLAWLVFLLDALPDCTDYFKTRTAAAEAEAFDNSNNDGEVKDGEVKPNDPYSWLLKGASRPIYSGVVKKIKITEEKTYGFIHSDDVIRELRSLGSQQDVGVFFKLSMVHEADQATLSQGDNVYFTLGKKLSKLISTLDRNCDAWRVMKAVEGEQPSANDKAQFESSQVESHPLDAATAAKYRAWAGKLEHVLSDEYLSTTASEAWRQNVAKNPKGVHVILVAAAANDSDLVNEDPADLVDALRLFSKTLTVTEDDLVLKKVSVPEPDVDPTWRVGTVQLQGSKSYGFILCDNQDGEKDVFFHVRTVQGRKVRNGDIVEFQLSTKANNFGSSMDAAHVRFLRSGDTKQSEPDATGTRYKPGQNEDSKQAQANACPHCAQTFFVAALLNQHILVKHTPKTKEQIEAEQAEAYALRAQEAAKAVLEKAAGEPIPSTIQQFLQSSVPPEYISAAQGLLDSEEIVTVEDLQSLSKDEIDTIITSLKLPLGPKKRLERAFKTLSMKADT